MIQTALKWHGGKAYLATKIRSLFQPHTHYVEPYFGGGSVLLAGDGEGVSEVVNDLNGELTNFWKVLQKPDEFYAFQRVIEATPFSEEEWKLADLDSDQCHSNVELAVGFFVRCRMSLAGRMDSFASLSRNRTRRGMNEQVSAWLTAIEGLPAIHARLKRVTILNRDALDVIRQQDGPQTLIYCDPPYLHETRSTTGEYGAQEMSFEQHAELLKVLSKIKGKFLLSGYESDLYDKTAWANGWVCHKFDLPNNAASGKTKQRKTECVWANFSEAD